MKTERNPGEAAAAIADAAELAKLRGDRVLRRWLAGASLTIPVLAILLTWFAWRGGLPEQVAFHWNASGRPDGTFPAEPLFWMTLAITTICQLLGIVVLLMPSSHPGDSRKAIALLGTVSAFVAAAWLVPAGVTYNTGSELGGWLLLFVAALVYGLLPRSLTPGDD